MGGAQAVLGAGGRPAAEAGEGGHPPEDDGVLESRTPWTGPGPGSPLPSGRPDATRRGPATPRLDPTVRLLASLAMWTVLSEDGATGVTF